MKLLSLGNIADLTGYTRAGMHGWAVGGKIPFEPARRPPEGQFHYEDTPELRDWCKRISAAKHVAEPRFATGRQHDIARKKGFWSYTQFFANDLKNRWPHFTAAQKDYYFVELFPIIKELAKRFPEQFHAEEYANAERLYRYLRFHPERHGKLSAPDRPCMGKPISEQEEKKERSAELAQKIRSSLSEWDKHAKLGRKNWAEVGNHFRQMGVMLNTLKSNCPDGFKARFFGNSEKSEFPFTHAKGLAIMNFAAKNPSPITGRTLIGRPKLAKDIIRISDMI